MSERGVLFSGDAAGRIAAAVRWQESWPQSRRPLRARGPGPAAEVFIARLTSGTADANGLYPAVITQRQPDGTYVDFAAVYVAPLNGEVLVDGSLYAVKGVDPSYDPDPAYLVLGSTGSGTAFMGTRFSLSGDSVITNAIWDSFDWNTSDYDTLALGVFLPGFSISINETGIYQIEFQVAWASNATGFRHIKIVNDETDPQTPVADDSRAAVNGTYTITRAAATLAITGGDPLSFYVYQNSGGNLNVLAPVVSAGDPAVTNSGTFVTITKLAGNIFES